MYKGLISAFDTRSGDALNSEQRINLRSCMIWNSCRGNEGRDFVDAFVSTYNLYGANDVWVDDLIDFFRQSPEYGLLVILEAKGQKPLPDDIPDYNRLDALHKCMEQGLLEYLQDHENIDNRLRLATVLKGYYCTSSVGQQAVDIHNEVACPLDERASFLPISRKPF